MTVLGRDVRDAVEATLRDWLPSALCAETTARGLDTLPVPRSWHRLVRFASLQEDQLPAVVIATPGTVDVSRDTFGWHADWTVFATVLARGQSFEDSLDTLDLYVGALRQALVQHPALGGLASGSWWQGESYEPLDDAERTLAAGTVELLVRVPHVVDLRSPWDTPPADPCAPVPTAPTVLTTHSTLEPLEAS